MRHSCEHGDKWTRQGTAVFLHFDELDRETEAVAALAVNRIPETSKSPARPLLGPMNFRREVVAQYGPDD